MRTRRIRTIVVAAGLLAVVGWANHPGAWPIAKKEAVYGDNWWANPEYLSHFENRPRTPGGSTTTIRKIYSSPYSSVYSVGSW